jgi:hypothetical protein
MTATDSAYDEVVAKALKLSPRDKARLIERLASVLKYDIVWPDRPQESLRGILAEFGPAPSEEDIAKARRDMMAGSLGDFAAR